MHQNKMNGQPIDRVVETDASGRNLPFSNQHLDTSLNKNSRDNVRTEEYVQGANQTTAAGKIQPENHAHGLNTTGIIQSEVQNLEARAALDNRLTTHNLPANPEDASQIHAMKQKISGEMKAATGAMFNSEELKTRGLHQYDKGTVEGKLASLAQEKVREREKTVM